MDPRNKSRGSERTNRSHREGTKRGVKRDEKERRRDEAAAMENKGEGELRAQEIYADISN